MQKSRADRSRASSHRSLAAGIVLTVATLACHTPTEPVEMGTLDIRLVPGPQYQAPVRGSVDAARARVVGPVGSSSQETLFDLTASSTGFTDTILGLRPGNYTIALEALNNGRVELYGQAVPVRVTAGQVAPATVPINSFQSSLSPLPQSGSALTFAVSYSAVIGAALYTVEWSRDRTFGSFESTSVTGTTTVISVPDTGRYLVRTFAENVYGAPGIYGSTDSILILADLIGGGPNVAEPLGFGAAANRTLADLNVVPADDEDWFSFSACEDDVIVVATRAAGLAPPSNVDTFLELFDPSLDAVEENDDFGGADSRLSYQAEENGTFWIRVTGKGTLVGHYELVVEIQEGALNTGTACIPQQ